MTVLFGIILIFTASRLFSYCVYSLREKNYLGAAAIFVLGILTMLLSYLNIL